MTRHGGALRSARAALPVAATRVPPAGAQTVAHQAARAQALLDRIAAVSDVTLAGGAEHPTTIDQLLRALDERDALLSDLEPVVAELTAVRGQLAHTPRTPGAAENARALDLALAPVEQAARRALSFHDHLLEKMQAMRDEVVWELDRLEQLGTVAAGYLGDPRAPVRKLDVRR